MNLNNWQAALFSS